MTVADQEQGQARCSSGDGEISEMLAIKYTYEQYMHHATIVLCPHTPNGKPRKVWVAKYKKQAIAQTI